MNFVFPLLIILAGLIPFLIGIGFGFDALFRSKTRTSYPDTTIKSKIIKVPNSPLDCMVDNDCNNTSICKNSSCVPACTPDLCKKNAVHKGSGRDCTCECYPGFNLDSQGNCIKNCSTDTNCDFFEKCENNECVDVCLPDTCEGKYPKCVPIKHAPRCECMLDHNYDPKFKKCVKNCAGGSECGNGKKCDNGRCIAISQCGGYPCGNNTRCDVYGGHSVCTCLPTYFGDPSLECVKGECITNYDCAIDEECADHKCRPSCRPSSCQKKPNQKCIVLKNHFRSCVCQLEFIYNKKRNCVEGCKKDDDCHSHRKCSAGHCTDICDGTIKCGKHAHCSVDDNRKSYCTCDENYSGNAEIECLEGCESDSDCRGRHETCNGYNQCVDTSV